MKNLISVSSAILFLGIIYSVSHKDHDEDVYRENIRAVVQGKLDGPDKSKLRDVIMTMNPVTGQFNPKEISRTITENYSKRSTAEGRNFQWEEVQSDIAGRVRTIMIDPSDGNKLWAGSVTGGLWYSNDFRNNTTWQSVSDDWENMSIACMTYDPQNLNVFFVGTGESYTSVNMYRESTSAGAGIYKSEDGGQSWSIMPSTSEFDYVNDIVVKIEDGLSVIYAAVASGRYQGKVFNSTPTDGLYRSIDDGLSWTQVLPNIPDQSVPYVVSDIELSPNGRLYVGTMRNLALQGGGYILYSDDGQSWEQIEDYRNEVLFQSGSSAKPGRVILKSAPSNGNIVYAMGTAGFSVADQIRDEASLTRIMRSADAGETWSFIEQPLEFWSNIPWHALAIGVDPNNPNKIVIGALQVYTLSDATLGGGLNWRKLSNPGSMAYFSEFLISYFELSQSDADSILNHYVHADIHTIQFIPGSSDEVLFATDGGVQFTAEMSMSDENLIGDRLPVYPSFYHVNNSLTTTQYYTLALHPSHGNNEAMGGTQDNSTHLSLPDEKISYDDLISGGDGAYCFYDSDDPNLKITSSQVNNYNFIVDGKGSFKNFGGSSGTFINPAVYDDRSNLLYANMATDGGFELLIPSLRGRFLDTLGVINVNQFLGKDMLGLDEVFFIKLGTNSTSAFSALKIFPYDPPTNATMILGNQLGDVYLVTGLPNAPSAKKIDDDQLPVGYISAVDFGDTKNDILVTLSNYGIESVWHTSNGGVQWINLDRDLPDIPVRDALFNPRDDEQIIIATEMGIWGLESIDDDEEGWKYYGEGMPNIRVDMIKVRSSDSVIAAATHGRGIFKGKYIQAEQHETPLAVETINETRIYPNPVIDKLHIDSDLNIISVRMVDLLGKTVIDQKFERVTLDVHTLKSGLYILETLDERGVYQRYRIRVR